MKTKTIKALAKINIFLDENQQKLSDKYKNLKFSYNRQKRLLRSIVMSIKANDNLVDDEYSYFLINLINRELNNSLYKCCERSKT